MAASNFSDKVHIHLQIDKERLTQIISLFISQGLPFYLTCNNPSSSSLINDSGIGEVVNCNKDMVGFSENELLLKNQNEKSLNLLISEIYKKYIDDIAISPPSQEEISEELNVSLNTFKNTFKALYGKTFYQIHMEKRMEYAAQLLQKGHKAIKVSQMVGYGEKSCIKFNKMFQKHFGITPKKYQLEHFGK